MFVQTEEFTIFFFIFQNLLHVFSVSFYSDSVQNVHKWSYDSARKSTFRMSEKNINSLIVLVPLRHLNSCFIPVGGLFECGFVFHEGPLIKKKKKGSCILQTQCSRGCSTITSVTNSLIHSFIHLSFSSNIFQILLIQNRKS